MGRIKEILKNRFDAMFSNINPIFADVYVTKCVNEIKRLPEKTNINTVYVNVPQYKLMNKQAGVYSEAPVHDNTCFVVAGGPSLNGFDFNLLKDKTTIVSNKSIFDVPNADYFVTTDYTFFTYLKKHNMYNKWKRMNTEKYFVANCISDTIQIINGQIIDTTHNLTYNLIDCDKIVICKSAKNVGFDFEHFNSGYNSGFSSFQLALIMGYKTIYLLGMDMNCDGKDTHYHNGYGKSMDRMKTNLMNYSGHFKTVLSKLKTERPDIKLISCSKTSILNDVIPYKDIKAIL